MPVAGQQGDQFGSDGLSGGLLAEELTAHVVVDSYDIPALLVQQSDTLGTDETAGPRY